MDAEERWKNIVKLSEYMADAYYIIRLRLLLDHASNHDPQSKHLRAFDDMLIRFIKLFEAAK